MATTQARFPFTIDEAVFQLADKVAARFGNTNTLGAARGVFGWWLGEILANAATEPFATQSLTPIGNYMLRVDERGVHVTPELNRHAYELPWSKIARWGTTDRIMMIRTTDGNSLVLPLEQLPHDIAAMIVEIFRRTKPKEEAFIHPVGFNPAKGGALDAHAAISLISWATCMVFLLIVLFLVVSALI